MTTWIYALLIAAVAAEESSIPAPSAPSAVRSRSAAEAALAAESAPEAGRPPKKLRADVHGALRAAATETGPAREAAVRRLAALYVELSRDTQLPLEERLVLGRIIRGRLLKVKEQISRDRRGSRQDAAKLAGAGRPDVPAAGGRAASTSTGSQSIGAAGSQIIGAAGGAAGPPDEGEALVELIQQTIAPSTWDLNGGLGTIRYYSPLHALVVRQTDEGHDLVGGIVNALRD